MIRLHAPDALAATVLWAVISTGIGCGPRPEQPGGPDGPGGAGARAGIGEPEGDPAAPGEPDPVPPMPEPAGPITDEDLEAMTAEETLACARAADDLDERIRRFGAAAEKDPDSRAALLGLVDAVEQKGIELALAPGKREQSKPFLYRAAELARRFRGMGRPIEGPERDLAAMVFYNEACNFALDGEPEKAMGSLREAVEMDFCDPIIFTDEELDSLRGRDDFRELLDEIPEPPRASPGLDPAGA
ncbi:TPR end-of-group domain-containing protein [Tautonia plasticadhaerens]|uniref:Uncharacterized protein n=1 Tax=Tautonia plasticadhaerens TaxID=2527974 RepID=A0A518HAS8_9BACT|nr:hypothetical protein [Tautonia plasticadhaerens]QDV37953.1 hypothetical protein ElP_59000 [Tautonia plasticadhaerens]